jgi:hypothetical protein
MTKERTILSGFAFTPPLLESMNMKFVAVGRFEGIADSNRPSWVESVLCASIVCQ